MRGYRTILWAGILAVALAMGVATVAKAQNAKRLQQAGAAAGLRGTFLQGLDLTDRQKEQIKTILVNHKTDIQSVAQETRKARQGLREAMTAGADDASLKTAYDQLSAARWNALMLRKNIAGEVKPILTPDQLAKLQKRLDKVGGIAPRRAAAKAARKHIV